MKKFKFFLVALLVCLALPNGVDALEKNYCTVFENGTQVVDADKVNEFEEYLKEKVYNLNNNGTGILGDYRYSYTMNVKTDEVTLKTDVETITVSNKFDTEEEAIDYYNGIILDKPFEKGEYKVSTVEVPRTETVKSGSNVCNGLECLEEIDNLNSQLGPNQKLFYNVIIKDVEGTESTKVTYKDNNGIVYFGSEEEAKEFAGKYTPTLEGHKFVKNEVLSKVSTTETEKTYEEIYGNNIFDTLEEVKAALDEFKNEYNVINSKVETVRDAGEDQTLAGSETFDTKEEADKWIQDNSIDSTLGELKTNLTTSKEKYDEGTITGEYSSREEAKNALDDLKAQGYIVNYNMAEVSGGITGNVEDATKINENNHSYTFGNGTDYVLIKQGSGHYAVWTKEELTDAEKTAFIDSYKKVSTDGSTSGISMDNIEWIHGFNTFDLGAIFNENNWGKYTFKLENGNVVLINENDQISHVVYGGLFNEASKYVLSGTKYKEKEVYKVDWTKVTYGFDYKLIASALVKDKVTKYMVVSIFNKLEKEATLEYRIDETFFDKKFELSYEQYIPVTKEIAYIDWVINRCEYQDSSDSNSNKGNNAVVTSRDYPNPPQTGVNTNLSIISNFLMLGIILLGYRLYRVVKNN